MGGANPEVLHEEGCSGSARTGGEWGVVMVMVAMADWGALFVGAWR